MRDQRMTVFWKAGSGWTPMGKGRKTLHAAAEPISTQRREGREGAREKVGKAVHRAVL